MPNFRVGPGHGAFSTPATPSSSLPTAIGWRGGRTASSIGPDWAAHPHRPIATCGPATSCTVVCAPPWARTSTVSRSGYRSSPASARRGYAAHLGEHVPGHDVDADSPDWSRPRPCGSLGQRFGQSRVRAACAGPEPVVISLASSDCRRWVVISVTGLAPRRRYAFRPVRGTGHLGQTVPAPVDGNPLASGPRRSQSCTSIAATGPAAGQPTGGRNPRPARLAANSIHSANQIDAVDAARSRRVRPARRVFTSRNGEILAVRRHR